VYVSHVAGNIKIAILGPEMLPGRLKCCRVF